MAITEKVGEAVAETWGFLGSYFVQNEIATNLQAREVHDWSDKRGYEMDFVLTPRSEKPSGHRL
jgi:predicted AAA+ superfamily ATPase